MEDNQKVLSIHCDKSGIHVAGANNIGSMSDSFVSCKRHFLRVCSVWWNTYCGRDEEDEPPRNCDIGTPEEQAERFNLQCFRHHTGRCSPHCSTIPAKTESECVLKWAQMPYEAKETEQ